MPIPKLLAAAACCGVAVAVTVSVILYTGPAKESPEGGGEGVGPEGGGEGVGPVQRKAELILNDFCLWGGDDLVWASVSVKDSRGSWVTGLRLKDFNLSEELVSPTGEVVEKREITFDYPGYQFRGDGFWERSVTSEKLDIVFLVDWTSSMEEEMPQIHSELHEFVDRLDSEHVDYRIAIVKYSGCTNEDSRAERYDVWAFTMPFRGVMESKEIHQWIDNVQLTTGEWWDPGAAYDQMMLISGYDFRDDARKLIVVITDTISQTVYGTRWYAVECTAATLGAVETVLKEKGIEVLYSQPPKEELWHLKQYYDPSKNPKAWAGFETLGTPISWPFRQEDIPIKGGKIVDSRYFFAWRSRLEIPGKREDYMVNVSISVRHPDNEGESLATAFSYVPRQKAAKVVLNVYDEEGSPIDNDAIVIFVREMGDRRERDVYPYGAKTPRGGLIVLDRMPIGKYFVEVRASGSPNYCYHELRYHAIYRVTVPEEGLNLSIRAETGERDMELAKARSLLQELDDWAVPGDPLREFVDRARMWLNDLESNGISWKEMMAIKRFYVALSGYANLNEYALLESTAATQNVLEIIRCVVDLVEQVRAFEEARRDSVGEKVAGFLLEGLYDVLTLGRFTECKQLVELGLDRLQEYASGELLDDLIKLAMSKIPEGPYKPLIRDWLTTYASGRWDSWLEVSKQLGTLLLRDALKLVCTSLASNMVDEAFERLQLTDPLAIEVKPLVRIAVVDLVRGGFEDMDAVLDRFSRDIGNYVLSRGRDQTVAALGAVFQELMNRLPSGDLRDFAVGLAKDLLEQAVPTPTVVGGEVKLSYHINTEDVVGSLVKHGFHHCLFKKYYVDKARTALEDGMELAMSFVPKEEKPDLWEESARWDFWDYRKIVGSVQEKAWKALDTQKDIRNWAEALQTLAEILNFISSPLDVMAKIYPPLEDDAKAVHGFIAALDAIQIVPRATELGLRLQTIDTLGEKAAILCKTAFGED